MMAKKNVGIYLSMNLIKDLKKTAIDQEISMSEFIAQAIKEKLDRSVEGQGNTVIEKRESEEKQNFSNSIYTRF